MKKVLALVVFFSTLISANAQLVKFGVTGDMAFNKASSSGWEGFDKKFQPDMGWSAGFKLRVSLPLGIGFDAAALFAQEDKSYVWKYKNPISSSNGYDDVYVAEGRLNYLSIPLNLRYDLSFPLINRAVIPYVFAGPEFNWYFDGVKWDGEDAIKHASEEVREQDAIWNLNFGFGAILFKHLELSYKYTVHLQDCVELKYGDNLGNEIESRFKDKIHKVALTVYF